MVCLFTTPAYLPCYAAIYALLPRPWLEQTRTEVPKDPGKLLAIHLHTKQYTKHYTIVLRNDAKCPYYVCFICKVPLLCTTSSALYAKCPY